MQWLTTHLEATDGPKDDQDAGPVFDLTGAVYRGRNVISEEDLVTLGQSEILSILEAPRPLPLETGGTEQTTRNEKNWTLLLQGWCKDDKQHPSDPAYWLKAAVEAQLGLIVERDDQGEPKYPDYYFMQGLVAGFSIGQGLVRPPQQGITKYTMFYIPLIIQLVTDVRRPYD